LLQMNKYALCLMGLIGGSDGSFGGGSTIDYVRCYDHYRKYILRKSGVDVFIHCWEPKYQQRLVELYQPKKFVFEKQRKFSKSLKVQNGFSRWYSSKRTLELKKQYEQENNFKYDLVMVGRFDTMWLKPVDFSKFDPQYFWASNYNTYPGYHDAVRYEKNNHSLKLKHLQDIWFFSNSDLMDYFGTLFDRYQIKNGFHCNCCPDIREIYPHAAAYRHLHLGGYENRIRYIFYRGNEYELYRWHVLRKNR